MGATLDGTVPPTTRSRLAAARDAVSAVIGAVMGLVPHVLHHVAPLAGAALTAGAGGNALFFAVGLLFSIPMLRRLHRRFHTWAAPAIAIVVFAALFSLSAFVIGPAISGSATENTPATPAPAATTTVDHDVHHAP
ncbi:MAG TPA: hypothetical protein VFJ94_12835 [Intrasporangium sp.]|uniref:hypothetical protein n=1 Tax=Intrasporangium sp. TaxID=1925024 RepID=UPI002D792B9D|nr:hypothetical protein [Intrasporangium sp.]HET7399397.1 hypothetical protein [Intrasporangium sp.]